MQPSHAEYTSALEIKCGCGRVWITKQKPVDDQDVSCKQCGTRYRISWDDETECVVLPQTSMQRAS